MKALLIVYHSMTGGTLQMAQAAAAGARSEPEVEVSLRRANDASAADLLRAEG
jgi:flavodoxin